MNRRTVHWTTTLIVLLAASVANAEEKAIGDSYPLANCPVSGKKLSSADDPVTFVHEGREIRVCCEDCVEMFKAKAADYIKKIDAAIIAEQKSSYPTDVCLVSGSKIGSGGMKPAEFVVGNRLVRVCCLGCKAPLVKDAAKTIAKLDRLVIEKQKKSYPLDVCMLSGRKLGDGAIDVVHANRLFRVCCDDCVNTVRKHPRMAIAKFDAAVKKKAEEAKGDDKSSDHDDG